jgi:putative restriction endonuclease
MKAVFTTKIGSGYDDIVEEQYHFPATYLSQVQNSLGDLIAYYEPRRKEGASAGGLQAYFAIARVAEIEADPRLQGHYFARMSDYLDLDQPVPFKIDGRFFEASLEKGGGATNKGAFGRSVRNISDEEFESIVRHGLTVDEHPHSEISEIEEGFAESPWEWNRPFVETTTTRLFRDRAFARHIQSAYDRTCAVSGLRILNGGGRPEVQAAHIRPVTEHGSDSVRNGIALSGTFHWMFDRGLLSINDDYTILVARKGVPEQVHRLINPERKLLLPSDKRLWPHRRYLGYHRDRIFKE